MKCIVVVLQRSGVISVAEKQWKWNTRSNTDDVTAKYLEKAIRYYTTKISVPLPS